MRLTARAAGLSVVASVCLGAGFLPTDPLEIEAASGEVAVLDLPLLDNAGMVEGAFRFTKLSGRGRWAPSAFVGFRDDRRSGKFRVFAYQQTRGGPLVAGYDYVLDDQVVIRELIVSTLPTTAAVQIRIHWNDDGEFRLAFFDGKDHVVATELRSLVPFIAVSSGTARFSLLAGNSDNTIIKRSQGGQSHAVI